MNAENKKTNIILMVIFWQLVIICVLLFKIINILAEPTVVYVEVPQRMQIVQPKPPDEVSTISVVAPQYGFTDKEIYLMAVLLSGSKYVDGDGEYDIDFGNQDNDEQISLVLNVVMNRVRSDHFPDKVSEVIWAPGQFESMTKWKNGLPKVSDISLNKVKEWCANYDAYIPDYQTIPDDHLYFYGDGVVNKSREKWYN